MIGRFCALRHLVFMSACSGMLAPALCSAAFDVIAEYNDASPDGNGYLVTFTRPALSNTNQVAFLSLLQGTQNDELDNVALIRRQEG